MKVKPIIIVSLITIYLLGTGCAPAQDFDNHLKSIAKPYRFSIASWEFKTMLNEIKELPSGKADNVENEPELVTEYLSLASQIKALKTRVEAAATDGEQGDGALLAAELDRLIEQKNALKGKVEQIIGGWITEALVQQKIFNPLDKYINLKVNFPPVNFKLERPPHLLVISPRDRIESIREVLLKQDLSSEEKDNIEAKVDKLDVSSLVVPLGGLATYPSLVTDDTSLRLAIDAATEEWVHQYLVFKPLGFLYLLDIVGISRNYDIATMNETLASMVSKEIGSIVYQKHYTSPENGESAQKAEPESEFYREMREIRRAVDRYLAQGEIEQAEKFMKQKQQELATKGYYIRKLNQAYFAFFGTYADSPTSISPIGQELKELRGQSASLKAFLNAAAAMTSRQELRAALSR